MKVIIIVLLMGIFSFTDAQRDTACVGVPGMAFVRNPKSCSAYYLCIDGKLVESKEECTGEFVFQPTNGGACNFASEVDCTECSPYGIQNVGIDNCDKEYINCNQGVKTQKSCGHYSYFNKDIGYCITNVNPCADVAEFEEISDKDDCNKFYICYQRKVVAHRSCPRDFQFRQDYHVCDYASRVNCVATKPTCPHKP